MTIECPILTQGQELTEQESKMENQYSSSILEIIDVQALERVHTMFMVGDIVVIRPSFRDEGDKDFTWQVLTDEKKNSVDICPIDAPLRIKPIYTVETSQIRPVAMTVKTSID